MINIGELITRNSVQLKHEVMQVACSTKCACTSNFNFCEDDRRHDRNENNFSEDRNS